ncbi:gap junction gamma-3 protein [Mesocricetus auratus]|uniref:Gap junction protein n=2 Tax=Mesocricetus auratus TaxID=10036 RepID=A0A1U8CCL1_MESAU|nr:gap junction gamma-3 protein [Mesocricetus auratus]XP_012976185.1 gap junction gamma-3 protein [Mesocricetus auratus]XP_021088849.1 gap junction gamma-3 protein [Mesocricetus auratus]XP_040587446.1 gap junction gamma-3 protein [Mesocricetus auratus]
MCCQFLRQLLAKESQHSTPVGRFLLPVLMGFRLLLLISSGPGVFGDDEKEFTCHLGEPGCKTVCYDVFRPLSPLRFWAFQVILMAVPSAVYVGFTLYHVIGYREEPGKENKGQESRMGHGEDVSGAASFRLLWAYVAHLGARLALEGAALGAQYHLYGFKMPGTFLCREDPCIGSITCFQSHPSEKTVLLNAMFGISVACLLFTSLELVLLGLGRFWRAYELKLPFLKNLPTAKSSVRRKDPADDLSVVETKEPL